MIEMRLLAEAEVPIDIMDVESWKGVHKLDSLYDRIWNKIGPKPAHSQRGENLVQTAKFVSQTRVDGPRPTGRCIIHNKFSRDVKIWSLNVLQEAEKDPNKRLNIKVEGKDQLHTLSKFIRNRNKLKKNSTAISSSHINEEKL
jgi:hypothetical protein